MLNASKSLNSVEVGKFAAKSVMILEHYRERLKEYKEYVDKLKNEGGSGV
jgi:hypothetical protein